MIKLAFGVSYCGTSYFGWQKQKHSNNTVQYNVEQALSKVANCSVELVCAGRTDSGVHGTGQIIHIETSAHRDLNSWVMGVNSNLPRDIRINWACLVDTDFHARFSALYRRYHYVIQDNSNGNAIFNGLVTCSRYSLNTNLMHDAAQALIGEQDFKSFQAAQCQSKTSFRCVDSVSVYRRGCFTIVDIQANAFLYHMVRNIVGSLILIGCGKKKSDWISELLKAKDRTKSAATAKADGLYLVEVGYSGHYQLPIGGTPLPFLT